MTSKSTDFLAETKAIQKVAEALSGLDSESAARVLNWAQGAFGGTAQAPILNKTTAIDRGQGNTPKSSFDGFSEFFAAKNPKTDGQKALVTGYWIQFVMGLPVIESYQVNSALRDLGFRITNITRAFSDLMSTKPQLVVQTKKKGDTKQAKKEFRLTSAGRSEVEKMGTKN